jgi:hypothetical protein
MEQVGKESRPQTRNAIIIMVLIGVIVGAFGSYLFYNRNIGRIEDRLDSIQQQITSAAPVSEAKPADGKPAKGEEGALTIFR